MTLIGKHILTLDDISHVIYDKGKDEYTLINEHGLPFVSNLKLDANEYEQLLVELGVEFDFPHTDIAWDDSSGHFVTECPTDGS